MNSNETATITTVTAEEIVEIDDTTSTSTSQNDADSSDTNKNKQRIVTAYIATYSDKELAHLDFAAIKQLAKDNKAGYYDAVLVEKKNNGKLHIVKKEVNYPRLKAEAVAR